MKDILECYKTLGIEPGAAPELVRIAYMQLCRFYDPARYVDGDPEHLAKATQKRKEIEEAYQEIRHFLPALQHPQDSQKPAAVQGRDFKEMVDTGPKDVSTILVMIVLGTAVALILGWGYSVYRRTLILPATPASIVDPDASTGQASNAILSTAPVSVPVVE